MNQTQRDKLFDICRRSKKALYVNDAERKFSTRMYDKYPDEYAEVQKAGAAQGVKEFLGPFAP